MSNVIKKTDEEVFCNDSEVAQETLRNHYLKLNIEYKCAICNIDTWQGKPITLRLDHIDGNNHNNVLTNLRWLCPNCDSQQETYCGRNKKHHIELPKKFCKNCGVEINPNQKTNYCQPCYLIYGQRRVENRPTKEELKNMARTMSFCSIGAKYNVSDNTIRKWCDSYGIPRKKTEIDKMSENEWRFI